MKIKHLLEVLVVIMIFSLNIFLSCSSKDTASEGSNNANSIKIVSVSPDTDKMIEVGSSVEISVEVKYSLIQDAGKIAIVLQKGEKNTGQSLFIGSTVKEITKGNGTTTLTKKITVPNTKSINIFAPLTISGDGISAAVDTISLKVNGYVEPSEKNLEANESSPGISREHQKNKVTDWRFYGELRKKYKIEDSLISKLKSDPPRSAWLESEKLFYDGMLENCEYDVLVVPFQTQNNGLDHVARILMSYKLATAIEKNTDLRVAPLHLIIPALGMLSRYYNESKIYDLAKKINVSRILWCYAGTQDVTNGTEVKLTYSIIDEKFPFQETKREIKYNAWKHLPLKPEKLPYQVFGENIELTMRFLNLAIKHKINTATTSSESHNYQVPNSPSELLTASKDDVLLRSYCLQFLALLAPTDYHKTYLFTRSLTNLFETEIVSPNEKLIEARALLHLYRRPAALKAIEGVESPEVTAFREYSNANWPELQRHITSLKPSIKRLIAELELYALKDDYGTKMTSQETERVLKKYPAWSYFLKVRLAHSDPWEQSSNVVLKKLLDEYIPAKDFSMEKIMADQAITAAGNIGLRLELLFQDHIRKAIKDQKEVLAKTSNRSNNIIDLDFLCMAESYGLHNLIKMIRIPGFSQCLYTRGLQMCDDILSSYKDHPYFTCYRLMLLFNVMDGQKKVVQQDITPDINDLILKTMWWNGRQNWVSRSSIKFSYLLRKYDSALFDNYDSFISLSDLREGIGMDYPFRVNNVYLKPYRKLETVLPWTHTEIGPLITQYRFLDVEPFDRGTEKIKKTTMQAQILSEINNRFNGHPKKAEFLVSNDFHNNKSTDKKALLQRQIDKGIDDWKLYKELASLYIAEHAYDQAKNVLLQFPDLTDPNRNNSIGKSNLAAGAGNLFFERGITDHAKYFYNICDDLDTGSGWCLEGQENLAILNKDFDAAIEYARYNAQRYNSPSAFGYYLTYLHLRGEHKIAWSAFKSMVEDYYENPDVWNSALIGHRIEGRDDDYILSWMKSNSSLLTTDKQKSNLARFGNYALMDRRPNLEMIEAINSFDLPVSLYYYKLKMPVLEHGKGSLLPYSAFSKGYSFLLAGDYTASVDSFGRMTHRFLYGYKAYAAIKSGKAQTFDKFMKVKENRLRAPSYSDFDPLLAIAVVESSNNHHVEAIDSLKKAFYVRPPTVDEPYNTMYYLLEICEWLYLDTKEPMYLNLLLEWCRVFQEIAPMWSWNYAIEAKYTNNQEDKIKALGIAQYLDRNSLRLKDFDDELKRKAKTWFEANNPFLSKSKPGLKVKGI